MQVVVSRRNDETNTMMVVVGTCKKAAVVGWMDG
jgi:hypothetical protein